MRFVLLPAETQRLECFFRMKPIIKWNHRVLELLRQGGTGQVFLAEDLKLQRRAALK